jgi:Phage terminase, small subunit
MTHGDSRATRSFLELTHLQERFIREYVRTGNAKRSAIEAGYSPRCAKQVGSTILRKPRVREALEALRSAKTDSIGEVTPEWALNQLLHETSDPNPRIRLDAKKAVAQAVGVFSQKQEETECPTCRHRGDLEKLSEEDLQLFVAGTNRERLLGMNQRDFKQWIQSVRDQAQNWITLGRHIRLMAGLPDTSDPE